MSDEQHEGEPNPRIDDACDSLTTQLEQMRRERDEARAKLARIREVLEVPGYANTAARVYAVLNEKEGGQ